MCGIAGVSTTRNLNNFSIQNLLKKMSNRGPDNQKFIKINEYKKNNYFFFSRLKIIDFSDRSNQPFVYDNTILLFNGEIYNYLELKDILKKKGYTFKTTSDTEVLSKALHFWGLKACKYLEGMWSFSYYNINNKTMWLSRDRFGEKPLYYLQNNNEFIYASEIKYIESISQKKLNVDMDKIKNFLKYGYRSVFLKNPSFIKNVKSVKPGTILIIKKAKIIKKENYFKFEKPQINNFSEKYFIKNLRERLLSSISIRLRSDTDLAICLSGGVDSNILANIIKKYFKKDIKSYSVISSDDYNESDIIKKSIKELNLEHKTINFKKDNYFHILKNLTKYYDSPVLTTTSLMQSVLAKNVSSDGIRVMYSGVGADELFSGYFAHAKYFQITNKNNNQFEDYSKIIKNRYIKELKDDYLSVRNYTYQNSKLKEKIFESDEKNKFQFQKKFFKSLLKNRMINELKHEIIPPILYQDDLNSMKYSVENRSPYLDKELYELSLMLPESLLIKNGLLKYLLRKVGEEFVSNKEILYNKKKIGFNISASSIFKFNSEAFRKFIYSDSRIFEIINKKDIKKILFSNDFVDRNFIFNLISSKMFLDTNTNYD